MDRVLEIRSYNLKPRTRTQFHELMTQHSLPMLQRWQIDVVAFGPSLHDEDSYFLMRSYASLEALQQSEDSFYGSSEWRQGPREAVLALIDNYTSVVITVEEATLQGLRAS
jgi:NIPSNAP